ncbi:hypothetical protein M0805_000034 [Coniferiporia weirii]|nr:hypothetical protein M0805_000034 [Coniferiporia weirii]
MLVGIFWDFENCHPPSNMPGYSVVEKIRQAVQPLGSVQVFKAYMDVNLEGKKSAQQHELQSSGVSLIHTPHNAKKEVADKIMLVDLMIFALDAHGPTTIVLVTGDRDFTYAISVLRLRGHDIVLITPPHATHHSLQHPANLVLNWKVDILEHPDPAEKLRTHLGKGGVSASPSVPGPAVVTPPHCSFENSPRLIGELTRTYVNGTNLSSKSNEPASPNKGRSVIFTQLASPPVSGGGNISAVECDSGTVYSRSIGANWTRNQKSTQANSYDSDEQTLVTPVTSATEIYDKPWAFKKGDIPANRGCISPAVFQESDLGNEAHDGTNDGEMDERTCEPFERTGTDDLADDFDEVSANPYLRLFPHEHDPSKTTDEVFKDLIKVLTAERAHGRLSTACMTLETLLLRANPTVYQETGVSDIREYLELAQRANVVFFIGITWETKTGYVFLRPKQAYSGRIAPNIFLEDISFPPSPKESTRMCLDTNLFNPASRLPPTSSSTFANPVHTTQLQSSKSGSDRSRTIEPHFAVLVEVLRELRRSGVFEIRRCNLSPRLRERDSEVYSRLGLTKPKGYISRAEASGIVIVSCGGKKGKTVIVSLHPDYF